MYGFLVYDTERDTPALGTIGGAIIVGTYEEMQAWPGHNPILLPDGIGPWVLASDILEQGRQASCTD